ncbi:energy-coupling factor transporter transmembrane component T family protein [Haloarchaeobius sp. TZWSO28]|uniref:energy-coupling factor transporter transmembrane component T family protein n=1 Tax=Haloarchaeobius sp. TZWSO28 TaxID=3446119 RepID=UPI003EB81431
MLSYVPDDSFAHDLDARAKLAFQMGFAVAVFANPTPRWLAAMALVAAASLAASRLSPVAVVHAYRVVLAFLLVGPLIGALTLGPPWLVPARAVDSALSITRVILVLFVSMAYVTSTPVRETRAAIQRHVPGKAGRLLGVGMALTLRFLPLLRRDVRSIRAAIQARGGANRSVVDRARRLVLVGLSRALERADRLSVALQARCFSWNPTPPEMSFSRVDYVVLAVGLGLALAGLVPVVTGATG